MGIAHRAPAEHRRVEELDAVVAQRLRVRGYVRRPHWHEVFGSEEVSEFELEFDCPAPGLAAVSVQQRLLFGCQLDMTTALSLEWLEISRRVNAGTRCGFRVSRTR